MPGCWWYWGRDGLFFHKRSVTWFLDLFEDLPGVIVCLSLEEGPFISATCDVDKWHLCFRRGSRQKEIGDGGGGKGRKGCQKSIKSREGSCWNPPGFPPPGLHGQLFACSQQEVVFCGKNFWSPPKLHHILLFVKTFQQPKLKYCVLTDPWFLPLSKIFSLEEYILAFTLANESQMHLQISLHLAWKAQ